MSDELHVVVVDDHPMFRDGVVHAVASERDIRIVGQGATAEEALSLAQELLPDIIMLDIAMPGGGLNAARAIATACPFTKIVMLTVSEEEDDVVAAFKAGARAYVLKGVSARELVTILRTVHAGDAYVTPSLAASLLMELSGTPQRYREPSLLPANLTERERQILELVAAGASNKEIGQQLHLTEKTVKHYMTNILQKLHVNNRVQAALLAYKALRTELRP